MKYNEAIEKIMPLVEDGDKSTPFVISRQDGEWVVNYPYPADTAQKFLDDVKQTDPFAVSFTGYDFARGSFPYCYDKIFIERLRSEYDNAVFTNTDLSELNALMNLVEENMGEFSSEVTDYLAEFDRPLAALYEMNKISLVSDSPDFEYDYDKIGDFVDAIENEVNRIFNLEKQEIPAGLEGSETSEKRIIEGYEEKFSIQLMGHYVVFAENPAADKVYLVCNIRNDNPQGAEESYNSFKTNNYVKAIRQYAHNIDFLAEMLEKEQFMSSLPFQTLTAAECLPNGENTDWKNKLIIVKADILAPEYRSAEHQLFLCTGGLGATAEAYGRAVYAKELYSGKEKRYNRHQIEGLANPEKIPEWAKTKFTILQDKEAFEYGGKHFKAYRKFEKRDGDFYAQAHRLKSDRELGISTYQWQKADYSHASFYEAANSTHDIFICLENGKLYVPCSHELFEYKEPPEKEKKIATTLQEKLDNAKEKVKETDTKKDNRDNKKKKHDGRGD